MPATSNRRRHRLTVPFVGAVLALGLLAGCTGQRDPGSYGDKVETNFVKGCTATSTADGATKAEAGEFCQCAYDAIKKDVEFDDFKKANNDLIDVEGDAELPKGITDAYESCQDR